MSNWKVGPGGRLYHPTTGAYVGQLDDNGNEQMVVSAFPSALSNLTDVIVGAQTDGQALVWDAVSGKWIPGSVAADTGAIDSAVAGAQAAQAAAEAARDAAQLSAGVYASTAAGLAGTTAGKYFSVPQSGTQTALDLYLNSAGSAVYVTSYPSTAATIGVNAAVLPTTINYGVTTNTSNYNAGTTAYGLRSPYKGVLRSVSANFMSAGTGYVIIARRVNLPSLTHQFDAPITFNPTSAGVNTVVLPVGTVINKGDIVFVGMSTGGGLRYTGTGGVGSVSAVSPTTGGQIKAAATTLAATPSVSLEIVQAPAQVATDSTLRKLKTGEAQSFASSLQTFGDLSVGAGAPTGNANSRGPSAQAPAGILYQVQWQTTTISKVVDANIVIYAPISDSTTTFQVEKIIPVSVMTDAGGIATATTDDIGECYVSGGRYVHVMGFDNASGVVAYTADARGGSSATGGTTSTVGEQKPVAWFNTAYAIAFSVLTTDALSVKSSSDTANRFASQISDALGYESRKIGFLSGEFAAANHTFKGGYSIPQDGTITSFRVSVTASGGTGYLLYLEKINTNRYRIRSADVYTLSVAGVNTFAVSIPATAGDAIAFCTATGTGYLYNQSSTGGGIGFVIDVLQAGGSARVGTALSPALQVTLSTPRTSRINATTRGGKMISEGFGGTVFPSDWTQAGVWTVSDGLVSPATGGYGVFAYHNNWTSIYDRKITMRVLVNDAASVFGIGARADSGSIAMVDGAANTLAFRTWTPSLTSSLGTSVALPAALVAGREYVLVVRKQGLSTTLTWTDTVTLQSASVTETITAGYRQFQGRPGVVFMSGSIKVLRFGMDCPTPESPRTLILGDSNAEGSNVNLGGNTPWPVMLKNNAAAGDVLIAAMSGDPSNITYRWANDLSRWTPRYVVIALGTNDTSLTGWRGWMSDLIAEVERLGAEPVLCTVPPKTSSQAIRTAMNADIKDRYFGSYRFVDFASALSTANDGVTFNPAFDTGDGVHINAAGQVVAYNQLLVDAPFLIY